MLFVLFLILKTPSLRANPHFPGIIIPFYGADFRANGVWLVLLALSITACANAKTTDNAKNANLTLC